MELSLQEYHVVRDAVENLEMLLDEIQREDIRGYIEAAIDELRTAISIS